MKDHCNTIDINESDAYDTKQKTVFGYFTGVRSKYKFTKYDPYYDSKAHKRIINYKNSAWKMY